jgi:sarcosine oxidase
MAVHNPLPRSSQDSDVVVVGGGIMGLFTAHFASKLGRSVTVLERSWIGDPATASFGLTRSIRNDYLDPHYARLAYEARGLWLDAQREGGVPLLVDCGCLNLAKESITPDLEGTYAEQAHRVLNGLRLRTEAYEREPLRRRFPQFDADLGRLDVEAGFIDLPAVTSFLKKSLVQSSVSLREHAEVVAIEESDRGVMLEVDGGGRLNAGVAVVTVGGLNVNNVLSRFDGCRVRFPISPDRPLQAKYFLPPRGHEDDFTPDRLPVFAYLDVGVYGHPWYPGKTKGVKIGFYRPPDVKSVSARIQDVDSFVDECMPELSDAERMDVTDVDQCWYDLVGDDNFIMGLVPESRRVVVGTGWRGTGYKYAPWVGRTLAELAVQGGTTSDISRFTPQRFVD